MTIRLKRLMSNIMLTGPGDGFVDKVLCRLDDLMPVAGTHLKVGGEN